MQTSLKLGLPKFSCFPKNLSCPNFFFFFGGGGGGAAAPGPYAYAVTF